MASGNGIDLAAVYQLLSEVAQRVEAHDQRFDRIDACFEHIELRLNDHAAKLNELVGAINEHTRRFDRAADILNEHGRKLGDLAQGVTGLRDTVSHYHNTVVGHGMLLNDFEERLKRIESRLDLDPAAG